MIPQTPYCRASTAGGSCIVMSESAHHIAYIRYVFGQPVRALVHTNPEQFKDIYDISFEAGGTQPWYDPKIEVERLMDYSERHGCDDGSADAMIQIMAMPSLDPRHAEAACTTVLPTSP